jgi:hypothetical protein
MAVAKTSLVSIWMKKFEETIFDILDTRTHGAGEQALNQISSVSPQYGRNPDGTWDLLVSLESPPGDLDTVDLMWLTDLDSISEILILAYNNRGFYMQRLYFECPPTDNRQLWKQLQHYKVVFDAGTLGAGPNLDGSDATIENSVTLKAEEYAHLQKVSISGLTTASTEDIMSVCGVPGYYDCLGGWPGADQIQVYGAGQTAAPAELLYSLNGGGTIAAFTTDPTPFTVNSDITYCQAYVIDDSNIRVICSRAGDAATKVEFAYQDFSWSATSWTAASWNVITIAATSNADDCEGLKKFDGLGRIYIGAAGDIYVSTDNGETDPGAAIYTGTDALVNFEIDEDKAVWAFGASGTLLRELANARGTFAARTGPDSNAFGAVAFSNNGTMYLGSGTKIFSCQDKGGAAASWTELKDFGASHKVVAINCKNGTSQCIRVTVDDTTPGVGSIWESEDGGNTWRLLTESANAGYNQAYHYGSDYNKSVVVGDDDGTTGIIELIA